MWQQSREGWLRVPCDSSLLCAGISWRCSNHVNVFPVGPYIEPRKPHVTLGSWRRGCREASCRFGWRLAISRSAPLFPGMGSRARVTSEDRGVRAPACTLRSDRWPVARVSVLFGGPDQQDEHREGLPSAFQIKVPAGHRGRGRNLGDARQ